MFFWVLSDSYQPVHAETKSIVVDMSMQGVVGYKDFFRRAETRVSDEISRRFSQSPNISEVEVVVVGDRHGEIVPILASTVSRTQWQKTPSVSAWTKYYSASYALLQRHQKQPTETLARTRTPVTATIVTQGAIALSEINRAFDEGRLTGTAAQEYLDELD